MIGDTMRRYRTATVVGAFMLLPLASAGVRAAEPAPASPMIQVASGHVGVARAEAMLQGDVVNLTMWTAPAPGAAVLQLPVGPFGWIGGASVPDPAADLRIKLDGSKDKAKQHLTATAGPTDITADLDAAGIDPMAAAHMSEPLRAHGKAAAVTRLIAAGALVRAGRDYLPRWSVQGQMTMALDTGREHRIELTYTARPTITPVTLKDTATAIDWSDYCLAADGVVRLTNRLAPGDTRVARRYAIPVAIGEARPDSVQLQVGARKDEQDFIAFCGYQGRGAVNPPGAVAAGVTATGEVRLIVLSTAKPAS